MKKINYYLIVIFIGFGKSYSQTEIDSSHVNKEPHRLLGNWERQTISNDELPINNFSITGFSYFVDENIANSRGNLTHWHWTKNIELENGKYIPIIGTCPFDTTSSFIPFPVDSLLSKRTDITLDSDTLYVNIVRHDGNIELIKLGNINLFTCFKFHSDNCFAIDIFLVELNNRKSLYLFSEYGFETLKKKEH